MICGKCKSNHPHVSDVRACYAGAQAVSAASHHQPPVRPVGSTTAMPTPDVAAGRYAVEGLDGTLRFYKVDRPTDGKWAGRTFVKVYASDNTWPVKGAYAHKVLHEIAQDPKAAMLRYGREIGACGHCGRTLTDETSRANGIGPVCAGRMEWAS